MAAGQGPRARPRRRRARARLAAAVCAITDVRTHERPLALLLTLDAFLLLTAYYVLKPVRDALILSVPGGAELKSYCNAGLVLLMLGLVPLYGAVADRLDRKRLILGTTAVFMAAIAAFFGASLHPELRGAMGVPFFLFVGVFGMMAVAQFWSFANDLYSEQQGVRLFTLIALGQSVGAVAGSGLTTFLLTPPRWWPGAALDTYSLLLVSVALLGGTLLVTPVIHRRGRRPHRLTVHGARPPPAPATPFRMILADRYLLLLGALHFLFTLVNSNGEYIMSVIVADSAPGAGDTAGLGRTAWIGDFSGRFYFWVSAVGLALQGLVVSRVVKYGGLGVALLFLPAVALAGAGLMAAVPILAVVWICKTAENATDYSLHNTVRQMLWLPTRRAAKYKAKQAVDTFFVRFGDAASGLVVFVGATAFAWGVRGFAVVNVMLAGAWLVLAAWVHRENRRLRRGKVRTETSSTGLGRRGRRSSREPAGSCAGWARPPAPEDHRPASDARAARGSPCPPPAGRRRGHPS